ncbi:MAG: hypothetical protein MI919_18020 [Holophagales bacterium]|nr:hypothetical protein [Holophagales bacterium]
MKIVMRMGPISAELPSQEQEWIEQHPLFVDRIANILKLARYIELSTESVALSVENKRSGFDISRATIEDALEVGVAAFGPEALQKGRSSTAHEAVRQAGGPSGNPRRTSGSPGTTAGEKGGTSAGSHLGQGRTSAGSGEVDALWAAVL